MSDVHESVESAKQAQEKSVAWLNEQIEVLREHMPIAAKEYSDDQLIELCDHLGGFLRARKLLKERLAENVQRAQAG